MSTITGTATATKSGSTVTVNIGGTITTVEVARDLTVASGDVLLLVRHGSQRVAVARLYTAAPATPPDADGNSGAPDPRPPLVTGEIVVPPSETRSYLPSGWGESDVIQGEYGPGNHTGCAFYASAPLSLDGATVTGATVAIRRAAGGTFAAQPTTLWLVTEDIRPSGAPTLTDDTPGPSLAVDQTDDAYPIPTAWAQALVDGTAGGVALYDADGAPYVRMAGQGVWSPAFTLTIAWQRST